MNKLLSITSIDSFYVTGRGTIYTIKSPITYNRSSGGLLGQTILLDGKLVKIIGIDSYAVETIREGTLIGILVKPVIPYIQRRHFADLLYIEMQKNSDIYVITADLGYGMFREIEKDFPNRFINVGAAEQLMLGVGIGFALENKLPICYSITPFLLYRPAEWIRNYLDHEKINVKLVGAGDKDDYTHDGFSHHIFNVSETMKLYPNISTYLPEKNSESLDNCFKTFLYDTKPSLLVLRK